MNSNLEYWKKRYDQMSGENVVGRHDWDPQQYDKELLQWYRQYTPILSQIKINNVLDFGCGIGRWVSLLSCYTKMYYGCDIVTKPLTQTMKVLPQFFSRSKLALIENSTIPFDDTKFDLIWTCVVLQHVIDDSLLDYYIEQFKNRMNNNGHVIISENITKAKNSTYLKFRSELPLAKAKWLPASQNHDLSSFGKRSYSPQA